MTDAAPAVFVALESSALGAFIRQSSWVYMAANVGHVLSLMAFVGTMTVIDLRMMGMFASTSPGYVLHVARRAAVLAFGCLVLSGLTLFIAEAGHVILNRVFQIKLGLIALALANVVAFEVWVTPKVQNLPPLARMPREARTIAAASLATWFLIAACGRLIAYF